MHCGRSCWKWWNLNKLTEGWWDGNVKRCNICKMIAGEFMGNTGSQGVQAQKKGEISRPKNSPGILAWFEQKGSLAVCKASARTCWTVQSNFRPPQKAIFHHFPSPTTILMALSLRRSPVRFLPFHVWPRYGHALHGQLPSCGCIWSHGVEKGHTAGVKPRCGWGEAPSDDQTHHLLR